jgi:hypothetical protein
MKNIDEFINEETTERRHVVCVKELETKHLKFVKGNEYDATRINNNWWLIDAVGVGEKQFKIHFKQI